MRIVSHILRLTNIHDPISDHVLVIFHHPGDPTTPEPPHMIQDWKFTVRAVRQNAIMEPMGNRKISWTRINPKDAIPVQ